MVEYFARKWDAFFSSSEKQSYENMIALRNRKLLTSLEVRYRKFKLQKSDSVQVSTQGSFF